MQTVTDVSALRSIVAAWRRDGLTVGFVPTMGALHAGHISLVEQARDLADRIVVSIFVNPTQFAPHEDLARYPRPLAHDQELLATARCDLLFLPSPLVIYPRGFATYVEPSGAARGLETDFRPQFFRGVATVVTKLFNLVAPDVAVFGQKDAQQLAVIRQLTRDFDFPIAIAAGATVREGDGLAMSSRNVYLSPAERAAATVLWRALDRAAGLAIAGERLPEVLREAMREALAAEPLVTGIDYAEVVAAGTFAPASGLETGTYVLPLAVRFGTTRLIDNLVLEIPANGAARVLPTT